MKPLEPRQYQETAVNKIIDAWFTKNHKSVLLQAATGAGKTVMAGMIMLQVYNGKRCMFVVHTKELVDQPIAKFNEFFPELAKVSGVVQSNRNHLRSQIICATFQSLASQEFKRLKMILELGKIDFLFEDECHRSLSPSRVKIIDMLKESNPELRILGLSATPFRADGVGMAKIFDHIIYPPLTIKYLTGLGHLTPIPPDRALMFELPIDFSQIRTSGSGEKRDYAAEAVSDLMDVDNVNEIIYAKWREHAADRRSICFTSTVKHATHLARYFAENGVKCAVVAGDGTKTGYFKFGDFVRIDRSVIVDEFKRGELKIIFNCAVLTEGFDAPVCDCIIIARPTRNPGLLVQMLGRGVRLHPGKKDCLVLSFTPINAQLLLTAADLYGRRPTEKEKVAKAEEEGILIDAVIGDVGLGIDVPPDKVFMRQIDLMCKSRYAWLMDDHFSAAGIGRYFDRGLRANVQHGVAITRATNGLIPHIKARIERGEAMFDKLSERQRSTLELMKRFVLDELIAVWYYRWTDNGQHPLPVLVDCFGTIDDAVSRAELYAEAKAMEKKSSGAFIKKKAVFRKNDISSHQQDLLSSRYGVDLDGGTADQASRGLYYKFAKECFGLI